MKALFDRTRVFAYADTEDAVTDGADGIAVTVSYTEGGYLTARGTDLDSLAADCRTRGLELLLLLQDAPKEQDVQDLHMTLVRRDMTARTLLASRHHRALDAMKQKMSQVRIVPICAPDMVRPWIYASYMGACVYLTEPAELLSDADSWGSPEIDRAHNADVCIFAQNVDDEETVRALMRLGCDAVITHAPAMARALVW